MSHPNRPAAAHQIVVPDPSLVVLVGPAGAGKSTFARRWFAPEEILSSDALRAAVSGDPANQSASSAAFAILHRQLGRRLAEGRLTVVDATNVRPAARRSLLLWARRAGHPAIAIVLDLPSPMVHQRNAERLERVVDPRAVDAQLDALRRTLGDGQLAAEGFASVHVLSSTLDIENIRLVRVRRAPG